MWRDSFLPVPLAVAAALSCSDAPAAPVQPAQAARVEPTTDNQAISFAALAPGDVLVARVEARGCFHHEEFRLRFEAAASGRTRFSGQVVSLAAAPGSRAAPRLLTPQQLTRAQLIGLDRLLGFYRAGPDGGCTSHDEIRLSLARGGRVIREESYTDGSCGAHEQPGVVTLHEVVWAARPGPR